VPVLDRVADPGNLGTILRTVRAVGVTEVWLTSGTADPFSDKVIRAALSAQFALVLREFRDLAAVDGEFRRRGGTGMYRTDPHSGVSLFDLPRLFAGGAIIFGSEAQGAAGLDGATTVTIPMPGGGESINVAQAATVFCGEFVRRTTTATPSPPPPSAGA
jgi:TrmH family RNA methyltransferase